MERQRDYWKLKALELEGQVLRQQLETVYAKFEAKRRAAYAAAGLDPAITYTIDDAAETFTPAAEAHAGAA